MKAHRMETNDVHHNHNTSNGNFRRPPADSMIIESETLIPSPDPTARFQKDNAHENNTDPECPSLRIKRIESDNNNNRTLAKEYSNTIAYLDSNDLQEEMKPLLVASSSEEIHFQNLHNTGGDIIKTKPQLGINYPKEGKGSHKEMKGKHRGGILYYNMNNNTEEDLTNDNTKHYSGITPANGFSYGSGNRDWKRDRVTNFANDEERRLRFPWKRIAYIGVLLVLGVTCAILALMKICGGAEWMNTATFSVILMGTLMLLPPGLYYGRILICMCCCKEYGLWDVPAGPFG